jgi:hypothetical protein
MDRPFISKTKLRHANFRETQPISGNIKAGLRRCQVIAGLFEIGWLIHKIDCLQPESFQSVENTGRGLRQVSGLPKREIRLPAPEMLAISCRRRGFLAINA